MPSARSTGIGATFDWTCQSNIVCRFDSSTIWLALSVAIVYPSSSGPAAVASSSVGALPAIT